MGHLSGREKYFLKKASEKWGKYGLGCIIFEKTMTVPELVLKINNHNQLAQKSRRPVSNFDN